MEFFFSFDHFAEVKTNPNTPWWHNIRPYSCYVLLMLLLAYLLNQLDRYMLSITIKPLSQELKFGDKGCMVNESVNSYGDKFTCNGTSINR